MHAQTTVQSPFLNLAPTTLHYFTKSISKLTIKSMGFSPCSYPLVVCVKLLSIAFTFCVCKIHKVHVLCSDSYSFSIFWNWWSRRNIRAKCLTNIRTLWLVCWNCSKAPLTCLKKKTVFEFSEQQPGGRSSILWTGTFLFRRLSGWQRLSKYFISPTSTTVLSPHSRQRRGPFFTAAA